NGVVADLDSTRVVVDLDVAVDVVVPHQDLPGVVLELDVPADRGVGHGDRSPVLGLDVAVDEGVLVDLDAGVAFGLDVPVDDDARRPQCGVGADFDVPFHPRAVERARRARLHDQVTADAAADVGAGVGRRGRRGRRRSAR